MIDAGPANRSAGDQAPTSAQALPDRAAVRVVDGALNLRSEPSLGAPVVGVLPDGAVLTVVGGPIEAVGYAWYEVDAAAAGTGWAAAIYLRPA